MIKMEKFLFGGKCKRAILYTDQTTDGTKKKVEDRNVVKFVHLSTVSRFIAVMNIKSHFN